MAKRGKTMYAPKVLLEEIQDLKIEEGLSSNKETIGRLVQYSQIGREVNRIRTLNLFGHRPRKRRGLL
jgi:hypothetical protein